MSARTTRMLVLGVVKLFGPANGYQLRRELLSWQVERWAHVNPGSVYSMLATLERQGAIVKHELTATAQDRAATVYTVTEQGAREFHASVRSAIAQVPDSGDVLELRVAMDLSGELTRSEFLADASTRRAALAAGVPAFSDGVEEASRAGAVPPHVLAELQLEVGLLRAQLEWLDAVIAQVEAGGLMFAGEDTAAWLPPEGDPGWRMAAEREGYRARIAGRP